jgi:hypothetical protein
MRNGEERFRLLVMEHVWRMDCETTAPSVMSSKVVQGPFVTRKLVGACSPQPGRGFVSTTLDSVVLE